MAKKSRRARRQQRATRPPTTPSPTTPGPRAQPSAEPASDRDALVAPPARKQVDFSAEYRYVISDLRSMAIIAIAMLVVLIALSYVIS
jgi:hypothetical protein